MNSLILTSIEQGLIFGILAIGVFITYKILDFPDLSVEGTFPLGAFLFAKLATLGLGPIESTILAMLIGSLAGLITYALHIKLKIEPILSGILTMTILYSVNLRINGKSNVGLSRYDKVFGEVEPLIVLLLIVICIKLIMDWFLKTEVGYMLIATGDNEKVVLAIGESGKKYKLIGLMISNGLVALSGALMAQLQSFSDASMGDGIIVVALASIVIGDSFIKNSTKIKGTTRAIVGAVIYKIIWAIAIDLGLSPTDLKAISAIIIIVFIGYNNLGIKERIKNCYKGGVSNVSN